MQIVKVKTPLPLDEVLTIAHARAPQFRALPGLLQKYYVRGQEAGEVAGVYLWDSLASLAAYRESELARSIAAAYQATAPPALEVGEVLFQLRN